MPDYHDAAICAACGGPLEAGRDVCLACVAELLACYGEEPLERSVMDEPKESDHETR